jgi:tRNA (guanine37-N1)-methyltransferase
VRIDVFSAFPEYFETPLRASLLGRARERELLDVRVHDLRTYATDRHRSLDDAPFGGGAGMVMLPEPLFAAVESVQPPRPLLLLSAAGERFGQGRAARLAESPGFSLLCGRYEGVDQRVADHLCDGELSIGDYVTAGGEVAALVVIEAVTRLVAGVMGNVESGTDESHVDGLLEYPHYTRPAEFRGWTVPEVVRSGDHARVDRWRRAQALHRTRARRPDLFAGRALSDSDAALLEEFPAVDDAAGTGDGGAAPASGPDLPDPGGWG